MIVFAVGASGHGGRAPSAALALEAPGQALIVRTAQLTSQIPERTAPLNALLVLPLPTIGIHTLRAMAPSTPSARGGGHRSGHAFGRAQDREFEELQTEGHDTDRAESVSRTRRR